MVYCSKCGTKNEEDSEFCSKCGARLEVSLEKHLERRAEDWGEEFGRRAEEWGKQIEKEFRDECFGLPHGGAIVGIIFGIIVLALGFAWLAGVNMWDYIGPLFVIIIGILIIAGIAYGLIRRQTRTRYGARA